MCQANKMELDYSFPTDGPTIVCRFGVLTSAILVSFVELLLAFSESDCVKGRCGWRQELQTQRRMCPRVLFQCPPRIMKFMGSDPEYDWEKASLL